ncbi:unnamed protein product [Arctogadus glacialis]
MVRGNQFGPWALDWTNERTQQKSERGEDRTQRAMLPGRTLGRVVAPGNDWTSLGRFWAISVLGGFFFEPGRMSGEGG